MVGAAWTCPVSARAFCVRMAARTSRPTKP
jgi:hypothetical protein